MTKTPTQMFWGVVAGCLIEKCPNWKDKTPLLLVLVCAKNRNSWKTVNKNIEWNQTHARIYYSKFDGKIFRLSIELIFFWNIKFIERKSINFMFSLIIQLHSRLVNCGDGGGGDDSFLWNAGNISMVNVCVFVCLFNTRSSFLMERKLLSLDTVKNRKEKEEDDDDDDSDVIIICRLSRVCDHYHHFLSFADVADQLTRRTLSFGCRQEIADKMNLLQFPDMQPPHLLLLSLSLFSQLKQIAATAHYGCGFSRNARHLTNYRCQLIFWTVL